ncbi:MAG: FAD-binding oxidoreductase [Actinomycetes bacterium]
MDLSRLAKALDGAGEVREATDADAVDGVPASAVVRPASVEAVSAVLREASTGGLVTVPRGGGTALDWGAPPERVDLLLDTTGLDAVVEHESGDLVVVVEAGLPVSRLAETVREAGQELVAEVPRERVEAGSTVGGALATAPSGPRRLQRGGLRDLVLGATVVRADGVVAASGGKVVKNVAGYDLAKLVTGAYGTLGVVVRAAFRLHPVPAERGFVALTGGLRDVAAAARAVVASQLAPAAVEVDKPGGSDEATCVVLLEGVPSAVTARQAETWTLLGDGAPSDEPAWWGRLPAADGDVLLKVTATLPGVAAVLEAARAAEQAHGVPVTVRGSAGGVLYAAVPASDAAAVAAVVGDLRAASPSPGDGTVTVLRAPRAVREAVDAWGPVPGLELMRRVKQQFDPGRLLSPGRFVGGI